METVLHYYELVTMTSSLLDSTLQIASDAMRHSVHKHH